MSDARSLDRAQWISVKKKLPAGQGERVQFWREPGGYAVGRYFGEGSWPDSAVGTWEDDLDVDNDACHNDFPAVEVTHWMPIPGAPK